MLRDRYTKRKIVGGRIGGNLFDTISRLFGSASKLVVSKIPQAVESFAVGAANTAGKRLAKHLIGAHAEHPPPKVVTKEIKSLIADIAPNPAVEKVLVDKAKQLLSDDSRAVLSNLVSGAGVRHRKRRGRGLARAK